MTFNHKAVELFRAEDGLLKDYSGSPFASQLHGFGGARTCSMENATHYGYVASGSVTLRQGDSVFQLRTGMYFCVPGAFCLEGNGTGFIASRLGFRGLFQLGGPVESTGRLRYIDGCRDTLLVGPPVLGDPCLNLLHIPPNTQQTSHTHPSERLGMIAAGNGVCRTPEGDLPLHPGVVFAIDAEGVHSFHTETDSLLVIAWHPDSDCGPSHQDHPMINRTMIDGVSAAEMVGTADSETR